jgi:Ca-activated chloride channel homolog
MQLSPISQARFVRPPFSRPATFSLLILLTLALVAPAFLAQEKKRNVERNKPTPAEQEAQEQEDTVKLRADLVVVTVTVTDATGQYAHGLTRKDFALVEDNAPQTIASLVAEEAPFAATILVDMSGSMEYKFGQVRGAAASFVEHIRDDDQVAVYGFNNKVRQIQDFSNVRDIADNIWDTKAEDNTRLYDCMDEAITALAGRTEKRRSLLLISDGCDTVSSKASFASVMKKAAAAGVTVYAIDLIDDDTLRASSSAADSLRRGRSEMKEFAEQTGGRYIHTPHSENLEDAFTNLIEELRNQYTLTYYSTNSKHDGRWRKLNVSVQRPGLAARARRGYWAPKS